MNIAEFLLARVAEDEAAADRAGSHSYGDTFANDYHGSLLVQPDRIRAECEAKRAIVELADVATDLDASVDSEFRVGIRDEEAEPYCGDSILYALAAVYRDHPDYKPEWKLT